MIAVFVWIVPWHVVAIDVVNQLIGGQADRHRSAVVRFHEVKLRHRGFRFIGAGQHSRSSAVGLIRYLTIFKHLMGLPNRAYKIRGRLSHLGVESSRLDGAGVYAVSSLRHSRDHDPIVVCHV